MNLGQSKNGVLGNGLTSNHITTFQAHSLEKTLRGKHQMLVKSIMFNPAEEDRSVHDLEIKGFWKHFGNGENDGQLKFLLFAKHKGKNRNWASKVQGYLSVHHNVSIGLLLKDTTSLSVSICQCIKLRPYKYMPFSEVCAFYAPVSKDQGILFYRCLSVRPSVHLTVPPSVCTNLTWKLNIFPLLLN